jgi:membrane protein
LSSVFRLREDVWRPLGETVARWQADDGPLLSAAVAYYLALSLFPLLLILVSVLGALARYTSVGAGAEEQIIDAIARQGSAELADYVRVTFHRVKEGAGAGGPVGIVTLFVAAMAIFAQFETAFDRIWNVPASEAKGLWHKVKHVLLHRLRAFLMLLGIGLFVVAVFVTGLVLSSVHAYAGNVIPGGERLWWWIQLAASLVLNAAAFTIVYKALPKVPIRWAEAARGAIVAAVVWEIGRQVLANYVVGEKYTAYGVVGALLAIMLWGYYAAAVIFLGAEYIKTYCISCDSHAGRRFSAGNRKPDA